MATLKEPALFNYFFQSTYIHANLCCDLSLVKGLCIDDVSAKFYAVAPCNSSHTVLELNSAHNVDMLRSFIDARSNVDSTKILRLFLQNLADFYLKLFLVFKSLPFSAQLFG